MAMYIKVVLGTVNDLDRDFVSLAKLVQFTKGNGVTVSLKAMAFFSLFLMK
jgi:hypothetical protein